MKNGNTPPAPGSSIDFSRLTRQDSDPEPEAFSYTTEKLREERLPSYFTATTEENAPDHREQHQPVAPLFGNDPGDRGPLLSLP